MVECKKNIQKSTAVQPVQKVSTLKFTERFFIFNTLSLARAFQKKKKKKRIKKVSNVTRFFYFIAFV